MKSVPADESFLVCGALKMSNKRGSLISLEGRGWISEHLFPFCNYGQATFYIYSIP